MLFTPHLLLLELIPPSSDIALEKLESVYKDCPFVQNICVYGDGEREFPIAIVFPFVKAVQNWADKNGVKGDMHELVHNPKLQSAILQSLKDAAKAGKLKGIEVVQRVILTADEWTPENGNVACLLVSLFFSLFFFFFLNLALALVRA